MTEPPRPDPAYGVGELLHVGDPVLEQVAERAAPARQLDGEVGLDVLREQQHADLGEALADPGRGPQPLVGVRRRHPDVGDDDVRRVAATAASSVLAVLGLRMTLKPESLSTRTTPSRSSTESSATTTRIASRRRRRGEPADRVVDGRTRITGTESLDALQPGLAAVLVVDPAQRSGQVGGDLLARISPGAARLHSRAARLSAPPR